MAHPANSKTWKHTRGWTWSGSCSACRPYPKPKPWTTSIVSLGWSQLLAEETCPKTVGFRIGPDETRTRDLCHEKAAQPFLCFPVLSNPLITLNSRGRAALDTGLDRGTPQPAGQARP